MPSTLTCADCAKRMMVGKGSKPQGEARCQPCRRMSPALKRFESFCEECNDAFTHPTKGRRFCCLECSNRYHGKARMIRAETDSYIVRSRRESAAPGLSYSRRKTILKRWIKQSKACAYCPSPATTIDHVVPLVRGGTNYEGNLTPCCKRCNSSKAGSLIVEWRTGRRLPRMATTLTPKVKIVRTKPLGKRARGIGIKLNRTQVDQIIDMRHAKVRVVEIAERFGISIGLVSQIANGQIWRTNR